MKYLITILLTLGVFTIKAQNHFKPYFPSKVIKYTLVGEKYSSNKKSSAYYVEYENPKLNQLEIKHFDNKYFLAHDRCTLKEALTSLKINNFKLK